MNSIKCKITRETHDLTHCGIDVEAELMKILEEEIYKSTHEEMIKEKIKKRNDNIDKILD